MSWQGFRRGLDELFHPPYLRDMSADEKAERRRRSWRHSELFFFFQSAEPQPRDTAKEDKCE